MDEGIQDPEFNNSVLKISSPSLCEFDFMDTYLPWCRVTEEEMSTLSEEDRQHEISKYLLLEFPWVINYAERQIDTTHSKRPQCHNFKASSSQVYVRSRPPFKRLNFFPRLLIGSCSRAATITWDCCQNRLVVRVYSNAFESPVGRCWWKTEGGWGQDSALHTNHNNWPGENPV